MSTLNAYQLAFRAQVLSSSVTPYLLFNTSGSLNITFLTEGTVFRNQVGGFLMNGTSIIAGSMVRRGRLRAISEPS